MPETTANIRHLQVLPSRSADLCFSVPGVIAKQNYNHQNKTGPAYLGQTVQAYSIEEQLYAHLGETISDVNDPRHPGHGLPANSPNRDDNARLKYDSAEVAGAMTAGVASPYLFALRNESIAAALDQAIARREGTYFDRFKHAAAIQQALTQGFQSILGLLPQLQTEATNRFSAIDQAHQTSQQNGAPAVVTQVKTESSVSNDYKVTTETSVRNTIGVNSEYDTPDEKELDTKVYEVTDDQTEKLVQKHKSERMASFPYSRRKKENSNDFEWRKEEGQFIDKSQESVTKNTGKQISESDNPTFFHPRLDNSISHKQLQAGFSSEKMQQSIAAVSAPHTERIIADENAAMDAEVRRLQVTFAESYLTSPISGIVTAVFKDVGECVQPGEAVMRIENDAVVFLVGRVQYFGMLRIGLDVIVRAADLFEANVAEDFRGRIRGIRGHEADDDEWEILIECDNPVDGHGRRKLPIYYQFDRNTTKIIVP
ncbi:hypothetical protein [Lacipirellula sp.]|uniref:hypothetical protein n=1 Tax=Lacipirellula sp. TaxID=2691419 RepID=UPI003D144CE5